MRNGRLTLRQLKSQMMRRFDTIEGDLRRLRRGVGGLRGDVRLLFDTVAEMDQEIKDHKRDRKVHFGP
jgi:hypothetical protein